MHCCSMLRMCFVVVVVVASLVSKGIVDDHDMETILVERVGLVDDRHVGHRRGWQAVSDAYASRLKRPGMLVKTLERLGLVLDNLV